MMSIIENIESDIEKQKQILKDLEAKLKETKLQSPDKLLAAELHGMLCTYNHTDGCGWYYEFKDKQDLWDRHAHGEYLIKAQKLIGKCSVLKLDPKSAIEIFKMVKSL